jgi:hypothetical protein
MFAATTSQSICQTPSTPKYVVIDGLNVISQWGKKHPRLQPLLSLVIWYLDQGFEVICISDPHTRSRLFKHQGNVTGYTYINLLRDYPQQFDESRSRVADPYVLAVAAQYNASVVSNDKYRKSIYRRAFPFLSDPKRRSSFMVSRKFVYVHGHRIAIEWNLRAALRRLRALLD